MKALALTGVGPYAISEIVKNHIKTLNLKNICNLLALESSKVGDFLFITNISKEDVISGTDGLIVQIKKISINNQSGYSRSCDETESVVGKVQIELLGYASCSNVVETGLMDPSVVILKARSVYDL
ncbi:Protein of unknown function DUF473 [Methanococcus maripaludis C5]|uniref:Uncharacterized protein n=1 Tax=Methanococcus maripaludis (strain C5 / ATCC BAA-1333) TaxID=402880 RepID=A4FXU6_METM5|nr:DUF473 domain-containing protein [Methanococcus maripaludis]ABO35030.1 Protein of unknown function DUF473 [Methanococcus maripaludis C5]